MRRWLVVVVALAVAGVAGVGAGDEGGAARPRNVVVIMTDDQRADSLWAMPKTLELLAGQGTTFTNSFASYPLCCPSRSTFLTGQYSHNHGVHGNRPPQGGYGKLDHTNTLPVWLQAAGYHTTHIGKYLNGYGTEDPTEVPPGWSDWQATVGNSTYRMYGYTVNDNGTLVEYGDDPADYQTDVLAARAATTIRERAAAGQPFFLSVAPLAPHAEGARIGGPRAAPRHEGTFAALPFPEPASFDEDDVNDKPQQIQNLPRIGPAAEDTIVTRYRDRLESLLAVDDLVEVVVDTLAAEGLLDDTVIIFTSDNGFFHGEHRIRQGKTRLYEESVRVPLVIRGPGFRAGADAAFLAANIDLAPTVVAVTGAEAGRTMDGRSLRFLVRHPDLAAGRVLLLENGDESTGAYTDAVRTERYLYAEYSTGEAELYDLAVDPSEMESVHDDPSAALVRARLDALLDQFRTCAGGTCRRRS